MHALDSRGGIALLLGVDARDDPSGNVRDPPLAPRTCLDASTGELTGCAPPLFAQVHSMPWHAVERGWIAAVDRQRCTHASPSIWKIFVRVHGRVAFEAIPELLLLALVGIKLGADRLGRARAAAALLAPSLDWIPLRGAALA